MTIDQYIALNKEIIDDEINGSKFGGHFDKIILKYVNNIENGFYVEAGGATGENTRILNQCGWTGMLIEPSETLYNWLISNRKNDIVEQYALVSNEYKEDTIHGLNTTPIVGSRIYAYDYVNDDGALFTSERTHFPATTFTKLAKSHNINKIDVFFLDTEGYELEVLKGIDFKMIYIGIMVIEINISFYSISDIDQFMNDKGFDRIDILQTGIDYLYRNRN